MLEKIFTKNKQVSQSGGIMGEKLDQLEDLFGDDEVMISVEGAANLDDLRRLRGLAYMADVAKILSLSEHHLRLFAHEEEGRDVDLYQQYGIRKDFGKWKVHLERFIQNLDYIHTRIKPKPQLPDCGKIAKGIARKEFFRLSGIYKLNDVMNTDLNDGHGFFPLTKKEVLSIIKRNKLNRDICGVWQQGKLFYIEFETFLPWMFSIFRRVELSEARKIVKTLRS